jgi:hypothetical protein
MEEPNSEATNAYLYESMHKEEDEFEDNRWRRFAYEQFMRDDNPQDAVYDAYE